MSLVRRLAPYAPILSGLAYAGAQLRTDACALAWIFLVPLCLHAETGPKTRRFTITTFLSFWAAQISAMFWLRHVYPPLGYIGLFFLTGYFAIYPTIWAVAARRLLPGFAERPLASRVVAMVGLAGFWIVLEWLKGVLFTGCPWMPLAATQWRLPPILALCATAGPAGPGFAIVLFNLGLTRYIRWIATRTPVSPIRDGRPLSPWSGLRLCPEFYIGLLPIVAGLALFLRETRMPRERLFSAGFVQTDFDSNEKWDAKRRDEQVGIIRRLTHAAASLGENAAPLADADAQGPFVIAGDRPDFILWPESALSHPVGREDYDAFLARLAAAVKTTLIIGGDKKVGDGKAFEGGIFVVTPTGGVAHDYYAKRHLVPFGEYVPFPEWNPLRQVVPIDMRPGENPEPLSVVTREGARLRLGALVCYEDIFPELGRDMAARGADALLVVTNDTWYGREAGAYQHAATSAMLAASTGLPVVRCGNAGWSGVISRFGGGSPMTNAAGTIYFRGAARADVYGVPASSRTPTFYVRHGDWFTGLGAALFALALLRARLEKKQAGEEPRL